MKADGSISPVKRRPKKEASTDADAMAGSGGHYDDGTEWDEDGQPRDGSMKAASFDPYAMLTTAAGDREFAFHVTASWADVRRKAKRIRSEGKVRITLASDGLVFGEVQGDHHVYETGVQRFPGSKHSVATYTCGCKWGAYHWGAQDDFSRFAGRMCSHALALQYEAASRGMFGKDVKEDSTKPEWVPKKVVLRYDIDQGDNKLIRSSKLEVTPLVALARWAAAQGDDNEEFGLALTASGLSATASVMAAWEQGELFHVKPQPKAAPKAPEPEKEEEEPEECEHCGEDQNSPEHTENHENWLHDQKWHTPWEDGPYHEMADTIHRGMSVDLPKDVHKIVHDDSRPMHERAQALVDHVTGKDKHLGNYWSDRQQTAREYAAHTPTGSGDDYTPVVFHAHKPELHHIMTDPQDLDEHGVYSFNHTNGDGEETNREVPLDQGAPVHLTGVSWSKPTYRKEHETGFVRHNFDVPQQHLAAVNNSWGEPSPPQNNYAPGPTKPRNVSENPGSTGWATQGDPDNWNSITPNGLNDRVAMLDEFLFEGAIPQEVAQSDDPLGSMPGTEDTPPENGVIAAQQGPPRPSGPKGGTGGEMPPGFPGMPEHQDLIEATLNMEPEGALPFTDGDGPNLTDDESLTPPRTASVQDIVAAFQATAGHLMTGSSPVAAMGDTGDIAAAAKAHLAKVAVKDFNQAEQAAIINEGANVRAANLDRLDIADTHYALLGSDGEEDDGAWMM